MAAANQQPQFPESWRGLRRLQWTGAQEYAEPADDQLSNHALNTHAIAAFDDYETLRREREKWLRMRTDGETQLIAYAREHLPALFPPTPAALPELRPERDIDMRTILLPQALNQGWLTERGVETAGSHLWDAMANYDAALALTMHACFQVTSTVSRRGEGPMPPPLWALHRVDAAQPMEIAPDGPLRALDSMTLARITPALERAASPESSSGIQVLRALFDTFMPKHVPRELTSVAWETTRDWTRTTMTLNFDSVEEKAAWIISAARAGLLAHYLHDGVPYVSMFPDNTTFIYERWRELRTPYVNDPATASFQQKSAAGEFIQQSVDGTYDIDGAPAPHIIYDRRRRAASVFYAAAVVPLVVASACAISYLRALLEFRIFPGTETPQTSTIRPRNVDSIPYPATHGLRALTAYTLLRLHATLGDTFPHIPGEEHATKWKPRGAEHLVGKTLAQTAQNLLGAWQASQETDRRKWTRALQAGLLLIAGTDNPE